MGGFSIESISCQMTPSYRHRYEALIMLASLFWSLYKMYPGYDGYGSVVQALNCHTTLKTGVKRRQRQKKLMEGAREFIPLSLLNEKQEEIK